MLCGFGVRPRRCSTPVQGHARLRVLSRRASRYRATKPRPAGRRPHRL